LTSKTFFGIVFGVPLATALGIEAASFLIFPGPCSGKNQKNIAESPTFFSDLQGFENLAGQKKRNAQEKII